MSMREHRSGRATRIAAATITAMSLAVTGSSGIVSAEAVVHPELSEGVGDKGRAVEVWQDRLNEWLRLTESSRYPIVIDGDFGPQTEAATREFQRANDAVVNDGTVDEDDRVALEAAISALSAQASSASDDGGDDDDATGDDADAAVGDTVGDQAGVTLRWWQTALNEWLQLTDDALYPIVVDGVFGPQTEAATRAFQRADETVANDGTIDGDDRVAIEAAIDVLEAAGSDDDGAAATDADPGADDAGDDGEADATADGFDVTLTWWQTALNEWLLLTESTTYPIVVDGVFDEQTEAATREFQRASDAVVNDGTVDGDDRVAIESEIAALESAPATDTGATTTTTTTTVTSQEAVEIVAWWQEGLNRWLELVSSTMFPIAVDGVFGPQTESATREFQRTSDAVVNDGTVDDNDRVALDRAIDVLESALTGAIRTGGSAEVGDERVTWWQAGLNDWLRLTGSDLYPIVVDGIFGPQTENATRAFQAASSAVDLDGTVEDDDRVALERAIALLE